LLGFGGEAHDPVSGGIALDLVEDQQGRVIEELRRHLVEGTELEVPVDPLDDLVVVELHAGIHELLEPVVCRRLYQCFRSLLRWVTTAGPIPRRSTPGLRRPWRPQRRSPGCSPGPARRHRT